MAATSHSHSCSGRHAKIHSARLSTCKDGSRCPPARTATARRVGTAAFTARHPRGKKRSKCMERQTMLPSSAHQSLIR